MTRVHWWLIVIGVLAVCGCLCALLLSVRATVVCLPQMAVVTQAALLARVDRLQASLDALPGQVVPPVLAVAQAEIRHGVDLSGGKIDMALERVDQALQIVDSRSQELTGSIAGLRTDLQPTLKASAALVTDIQASIDDLYPDVKGSVASATVAITSAAYASEAVRDAAPKVAESVVGIGQSAAGIAADVKREADILTAPTPKHWWSQWLGPVYTIGRLVAAFL